MISPPASPLYPAFMPYRAPVKQPGYPPVYPQPQTGQPSFSLPGPQTAMAHFPSPPAVAAPLGQTPAPQAQMFPRAVPQALPASPVTTSYLSNNSWLLPTLGIVGTVLAGGIIYKISSPSTKPEQQPAKPVTPSGAGKTLPNQQQQVASTHQAADTKNQITGNQAAVNQATGNQIAVEPKKSETSHPVTETGDVVRETVRQAEKGKVISGQTLPKPNPEEFAKGAAKAGVFVFPDSLGGLTNWNWRQSFRTAGSAVPKAATKVVTTLSGGMPNLDSVKPVVSAAASAAQSALKPGQRIAVSAAGQFAKMAKNGAYQAYANRASIFGAVGMGLTGLGLLLFSKPDSQSVNESGANNNTKSREQTKQDQHIAAFVKDSAINPPMASKLAQIIKQDKALLDLIVSLSATPRQVNQSSANQVMDKYVTALLAQGKRNTASAKNENEWVVELLYAKARLPIPLQLNDGTLTLNAALRNNRIALFATALKEMTPEESAFLLNKKDRQGQTALQAAVQNRHMAEAKELLKKGADPFVLDTQKKTAWEHLWGIGQVDQLKALLNAYNPASLDCADQLKLRKELSQVRKNRNELVIQANAGTDLRLNTAIQTGNALVKAGPGDILQVSNALYKVTPELMLVNISSNAKLINYLFPKGVNKLDYKQGHIGDCAKLTQIHALLDDPSGVGIRALLDRFSEDNQNIYLNSIFGTKIFKKADIQADRHGNLVYRRKSGEKWPVEGPLGLNLLERGHYRDVRQEADEDSDTVSVAGTLIESNLKKDRIWSDDYGIGILGQGFWMPYTQDGTVKTGLDTAHWDRKQKHNWGEGLNAPFGARSSQEKKRIEEFLTQFEKNPSSFRGIVATKYVPKSQRKIKISLLDSTELLSPRHAYYFKSITRNLSNQRTFQVVNPHDGSRMISLSERDFMNNCYMFNGITPRVKTS